jgi:hypothetical protein
VYGLARLLQGYRGEYFRRPSAGLKCQLVLQEIILNILLIFSLDMYRQPNNLPALTAKDRVCELGFGDDGLAIDSSVLMLPLKLSELAVAIFGVK